MVETHVDYFTDNDKETNKGMFFDSDSDTVLFLAVGYSTYFEDFSLKSQGFLSRISDTGVGPSSCYSTDYSI